MKKIFTILLLSVTMIGSAFAQYGHDKNNKDYGKNNDIAKNDSRYKKDWDHSDDRHFFSKKEMMMQIAQINREYDFKIQSVREKYFMSRFKKERIIRSLEEDRKYEIKKVYAKFNDQRNGFGYDKRREW